MDESASVAESRRLFRALAQIERQLAQLDERSGPQALAPIICLIEAETQDFELRSRLEAKYNLLPAYEWSTQIKNELNAMLGRSSDPVYLGNVYVSLGKYVEALPYYNRTPHRLLLTSHVNLLQKNYALIESTVGSVWQTAQRARNLSNQKDAGLPLTPPPLSNEVLLNLALGYWCLHEYGKCLAVILSMQISEISGSAPKHLWLTSANVQAILFSTAWLCLRPQERRFLRTSDAVAQFYQASPLILRAETGSLADFWEIIADLQFPFNCSDFSIKSELRDAMGKQWLQLHSQVPRFVALRELGRGLNQLCEKEKSFCPTFGETELLSDLRRWKLLFDYDAVDQQLVRRTAKQQAEIARSQMFAVGESLASKFRRDALVSQWRSYGPNGSI